MRINHYAPWVILFISQGALAEQFCFSLAQTVYEQIYCELAVKAQTKGLPDFNQFRKNSEPVQASLLRRPAERNNIRLPPPKRPRVKEHVELVVGAPIKSAVTIKSSQSKSIEPNGKPAPILNQGTVSSSGCNVIGNRIECDRKIYQLQGNRHNRHLAADVLSDAHKMALPVYEQGQGMNGYLTKAYEQYINKMCAIGLCGVTTTFAKFSFLYQDIQAKGLDFVQRFELMYTFLKKDKATMAVSEAVQAPAALSIDDCQRLNQRQFVCAYQGRNYIYNNTIYNNTNL